MSAEAELDLEKVFDENLKTQAQLKAARHVDLAIDTLVAVCKRRNSKDRKASDSAKVSAARTILEQAEGKVPVRHQHEGSLDGLGLTVQILHLSTGTMTEHLIAAPIPLDDQLEQAQKLAARTAPEVVPWD